MALGESTFRSALIHTMRIEEGCSVGCDHCGAYPRDRDPGDYVNMQVTRERIEKCLNYEFWQRVPENGSGARFLEEFSDREVRRSDEAGIARYVKMSIVDLVADYFNTDVNGEPLNGDAILWLMDFLRHFGKRVVFMTHGLLFTGEDEDGEPIFAEGQAARLQYVVNRMDQDDEFVLTMDRSRHKGKIGDEVNRRSYLETLKRIKPLLDKGTRVCVSVQGNDDPEDRLYRGNAENLLYDLKTELLVAHGWKSADLQSLTVKFGRDWVGVGRSKMARGIKPEAKAPLIPDPEFITERIDATFTSMLYLDIIGGNVWKAPFNAGSSYNDVAALSNYLSARGKKGLHKIPQWELLANLEGAEDLTPQFSRESRLAALKKSVVIEPEPVRDDGVTVHEDPTLSEAA